MKEAGGGDQPLDIVSLNPNKALNESDSTLEYMIVSLCQALNLQPKQAAGLLTNHNHYLLHACIKGVKGNFTQILAWYQGIYATSRHLASLTMETFSSQSFHGESNSQGGMMLLNALKSGFFSECMPVAEWTCKLFSKIAMDFEQNSQLTDLYQWFIQVPSAKNGQLGGGLEAVLYSLNKHSQIVEHVCNVILAVFKGNLSKLISELRQNHTKKNLALLPQLINEMLPYLHRSNKEDVTNELLLESGIIEECVRNGDSEVKDDLFRS